MILSMLTIIVKPVELLNRFTAIIHIEYAILVTRAAHTDFETSTL